MDAYRVALVGCGPRGRSISAAYAAHPRTELVGVCDVDRGVARRLGGLLQVDAQYTSIDHMISVQVPHIVIIATGTEHHHELAMRALDAGCNIDIEKPLATDLVQADEIIRLAARRSLRVAVHHQGRVCSAMRAAQRAVEQGRIGDIRYIVGSGKGYYGGYGLLNIGTHTIVDMLAFGGPVSSVSAELLVRGRPARPEDVLSAPNGMGALTGESITATFRFASGITATLLQHRFPVVDNAAYSVNLYGTAGRILWKTDGAYLLPVPHHVPDGVNDAWQRLEPIPPPGYDPESCSEAEYWYVDEYVRALDAYSDHPCGGAEALHALEIIMGTFDSGVRRRPVTLPQRGRHHPLLRWREKKGLGAPEPAPRSYVAWLTREDRRLAALAAAA